MADAEEHKDFKLEEEDAVSESFDANDKKLIKEKLKEPFSYNKLI